MNTKKYGTGSRIVRRIEELLEQSTLSPETVLKIMRTAGRDENFDPHRELERLQREQHHDT